MLRIQHLIFAPLKLTKTQIISATTNNPNEHGTHFRGVKALFSVENSPFSGRPVEEIIREEDSPLGSSPCNWPVIVRSQ